MIVDQFGTLSSYSAPKDWMSMLAWSSQPWNNKKAWNYNDGQARISHKI